MNYECLLFDLDGTLIDSRADLATSVNLMLEELGLGPLAEERVIGFVGEGARLLVERSLRAACGREEIEGRDIDEALAIFVRHYRAHLLDRTVLYPGVREALAVLDGPLGIVTNKPYELTIAILEALGLRERFSAILGGDSLPERKPSPMMLFEAARLCQAAPAATLMIGDSRIDIEAGRSAGMVTCGFSGGFRGIDELRAAGADLIFGKYSDLPKIIGACAAKSAQ